MELTANREKELANVFEEIFSQKEMLSNALLRDDEHFFEIVTDEALMAEGYPENANYHNTSVTVEMDSQIAYDMWAEIYWYDEDMENFEDLEEEFKNHLEREETIIQCILNNTDRVDFNVVIYDTFEEVVDANPDFEAFKEKFYDFYDELIFKEYIDQDPENIARDFYTQALIDEFGTTEDIPLDLEAIVEGVYLVGDVVERLYENYSNEEHPSLFDYMSGSEIYTDIIDFDLVDIDFEFNYDDFYKDEENPSVEYWQGQLEAYFDDNLFKEALMTESDDEILEQLNHKLAEEGFDIELITDLSNVPVDWAIHVDGNPNMQKFAEYLYNDDTVPEAYETVRDYVESPEYYEDLIEENIVNWHIEITSDPEDFE